MWALQDNLSGRATEGDLSGSPVRTLPARRRAVSAWMVDRQARAGMIGMSLSCCVP